MAMKNHITSLSPLDHNQPASNPNEALINSFQNCSLEQKSGSSVVKWWTRELSRKRADERMLFNRSKANKDLGACRTTMYYNRAIRTTKRDSWRKFTLDARLKFSQWGSQALKCSGLKTFKPSWVPKKAWYLKSARETLVLLLNMCNRMQSGHTICGGPYTKC